MAAAFGCAAERCLGAATANIDLRVVGRIAVGIACPPEREFLVLIPFVANFPGSNCGGGHVEAEIIVLLGWRCESDRVC